MPPYSPVQETRSRASSKSSNPIPPMYSRSSTRSSSSPRRRRASSRPIPPLQTPPPPLNRRMDRWAARKKIAMYHPHLKLNRHANPAEISPQLTLLLCDNTRILMSAFNKYDYDRSGSLDRQEFRDMIMKMAAREHFSLTCQDADMIMKAFDADNSGYIDRYELAQGIQNAHSVCQYDSLNRRLPPKNVSPRYTMSQRLGLSEPPANSGRGRDIYQQRMAHELQYSSAPFDSPRTPVLFTKSPTERRARFLRKKNAIAEEALAKKTEELMTHYKESTLSDHGPVLKKGLYSSTALGY